MFSAFAVEGLEGKEKGKFTGQKLAPLAKDNFESFKDDEYFTHVTVDGDPASLADPLPAYWFDYKDEILTLNFTLPFKRPAKAKELKIEIHDPAYYIDFELVKQAPAHLIGAVSSRVNCRANSPMTRETS